MQNVTSARKEVSLNESVEGNKMIKEKLISIRCQQPESRRVNGDCKNEWSVANNRAWQSHSGMLPIVITDRNHTSLLGRNWLQPLKISVNAIGMMKSLSITNWKRVFPESFDKSLIKLNIDINVRLIRLRTRNISLNFMVRMKKILINLRRQGILEPVTNLEWLLLPIVVAFKSTENIRLCGDHKCTVNKAFKWDLYQSGASSALTFFQHLIEEILVIPYFDDILITASNENELNSLLRVVLRRLSDAGVHLKLEKCGFNTKYVTFLGYAIDSDGMHPTYIWLLYFYYPFIPIRPKMHNFLISYLTTMLIGYEQYSIQDKQN
ncbi:hypothetical protein PR048_001041 [Dryococelus australis]|uniref:Reverse transcriptase domain-containing protein n=1 Tax=Dryococelus australis TaxID=614101 RepID=A0ABQ9IHQ9_9NEOP|nr:hypothetical protein PR048_001041 [Dryococelus australis]